MLDESSSFNDYNSENRTILSELLASCDRISQPNAEASIAQWHTRRQQENTVYCSATIFQLSFERVEPR